MRVAKVVIRLVVSFMKICEGGKLWGIHRVVSRLSRCDVQE